ncbi:heme-binding protein [Egicoccus sp. AB-alg2]|uniref:GlcG/HbpS family heme-binding protein n=1 Tax=Egicoccus sp. AB-alg2 TaxID=3242693 RepID=UPI00359E500B
MENEEEVAHHCSFRRNAVSCSVIRAVFVGCIGDVMSVPFAPALAAEVVRVGIEIAEAIGSPMAVAFVDGGARLVAFARTTDATPAAVDAAPAKARTALWFGRPTADTLDMAERRPVVYETLLGTSPHPLVLSMGGLCLQVDGHTVGAIGAAGARLGATDVEVAQAMLRTWVAGRDV